MDVLETIDLPYEFLNNNSNKLHLELTTWTTKHFDTKQDEALFSEDTKWLSDEPRKSKPKKSVLSTAVYTLDDSSSDDDEPPTPTNSTGFLPLRRDSVESESDYSVSSDNSSEQRDDCLEKEKSLSVNEEVSTTMQPIQTQTQQITTTLIVNKKSAQSWIRGLLKKPSIKPPKVVNLFKKPKQKQQTSSNKLSIPETKKSIIIKSLQPKRQKEPHDDYTRYPLDTERAIYRLSHVKLANSRRPLHQQVVISNMMYWYLSILKKYHPHLLNTNRPHRHSSTTKRTPHYDADASFVAEKLKSNKYKPVINTNYNPTQKNKSFN